MQKIPDNWTYEEFHTFALLYAANIDGAVSNAEEELILKQIDPDSYKRIKAIFESCDDADCLDGLLQYRSKYLGTHADKERMLKDMAAVFEVNHRYLQIERELLHLLDRML
ncbi:MAG: TerB family tellurite resistance protein [Bacteroidetes bacterium]|nr:TerB family tellurite resistance protein [Bacteroidota bacterium]